MEACTKASRFWESSYHCRKESEPDRGRSGFRESEATLTALALIIRGIRGVFSTSTRASTAATATIQ